MTQPPARRATMHIKESARSAATQLEILLTVLKSLSVIISTILARVSFLEPFV
jgi:hypothetical protein